MSNQADDLRYNYLRSRIGPTRTSELFKRIAGFLWDGDEEGFTAWRKQLDETENEFIHLACSRLGAFIGR